MIFSLTGVKILNMISLSQTGQDQQSPTPSVDKLRVNKLLCACCLQQKCVLEGKQTSVVSTNFWPDSVTYTAEHLRGELLVKLSDDDPNITFLQNTESESLFITIAVKCDDEVK